MISAGCNPITAKFKGWPLHSRKRENSRIDCGVLGRPAQNIGCVLCSCAVLVRGSLWQGYWNLDDAHLISGPAPCFRKLDTDERNPPNVSSPKPGRRDRTKGGSLFPEIAHGKASKSIPVPSSGSKSTEDLMRAGNDELRRSRCFKTETRRGTGSSMGAFPSRRSPQPSS